ncbi:uncharacterized protein LOC128957842 [Oppia nitens]|uniref:uncharacterized protein LOC128957842 n=1 Tax=Oppia nitens TaxID=1686743 RepID=UPI0023DBECA8|nr:uncharacterized protein LOC128957842 [Oppia nitens]
MIMDVEEVVKSGSLYVPPQGFLKQKKSWQKKYYVLYRNSHQGIQRLEVFDSEDQYIKQHNCLRIIPLSDCLKVVPLPQKQQSNVFEIRTKDTTYLFSCETFQEMTEWLNCLQSVAFGVHQSLTNTGLQNKSFTIDSNANQFNNINITNISNNSSIASKLSDIQTEENLLYSSVDGPQSYRVKLIDSDASLRCGLRNSYESNYTLLVTAVNISLAEDDNVLLTWPYRHIRRYGCTKDGFSLEAGRKCASGEGLFSFITKDGNSIFQGVATHVNSLKASRHLTDDFKSGNNDFGIINISPKPTSKEIPFALSHFYANDSKSPSPPLSSSYSTNSSYLETNSSLLPSSKISELKKRHSVQPPKSPKINEKQILTQVTSVSNTNSIIMITDSKPKISPPVLKPPRKSKENKITESSEPVFASREEVFRQNSLTNNFDTKESYKSLKDEILYDEPVDLTTDTTNIREDDQTKSSLCPSPPPVTQTVSKLTSVLKMMFSGNGHQNYHQNYGKHNRVSIKNSISENTSNVSSTLNITASQPIETQDLPNSDMKISQINKEEKIANNLTDDTYGYSEVTNDNDVDNDTDEGDYENVRHLEDLNELNISIESKQNKLVNNNRHNSQQTEHYVQNDCEYARVVKRPANNTLF